MKTNIVAELGINFNGDIKLLCSMATKAKECGADYVKIQKREVDWCYSEEQLKKPCESPWGTTVEDKVRGRELSWSGLAEFDFHCVRIGIPWFSSCFDLKSLKRYNASYDRLNKIPSALSVRKEYLKKVASFRRMTLISTGLLKSIEEIAEVASIFEKAKCWYILNHCVALYPCPPDRLNLKEIETMREVFIYNTRFADGFEKDTFSNCKGIGYSGHETGVMPSVIAVQLGATWVERHFTLDRAMYGADQPASLEPQGFARMVRDIRCLEKILGSNERKLHGDEKNPVTFWRDK